jgi:serine/threonine-protein kinase
MSDSTPPVISDRYQLVRHIARGGMAQVYLAQDLLLDRPVALKVLFPELSVDENFVRRFRREAQAAANLSNPNIVSVYDWGQGDRTYFIVMEYVDGRTLSSLIKEGPIEPVRAATIGAEVAGALEFAHRRDVIHRDVKPGNVLIDNAGQVKVTDFGIARAAGASEGLTQTGAVMGTATYFSPEQAQGYQVDARSDIYSLGVVLYEMVTGQVPFSGDNPVAIAYKHVREEPVAPRLINPAIPASLEAIILKAMSKEVEDRYQTARELQADLLRFRSGQPVLATERTRGAADPTVVGRALGPDATRVSPALPTSSTRSFSDPTRVAGGARAVDTYDDGPGRIGLWIALGAVIVVLLAGGGYFLFRGSSTKTVAVPNVVGQTATSAEAQLHASGFTNLKEVATTSDTVTQGVVISTTPANGVQIKKSRLITLKVSGGPVLVAVPRVVGLDQADATDKLVAAGFRVNAITASSGKVGQGLVITTSPTPGAKAGKGSTVQITVSTGKTKVVIPSLVNDSPAQAGNALGALGLSTTSMNESSATVPTGEVTRTDPPANSSVAKGSMVTIYVSTGPAQVQVPYVIGDSEAAAQTTLQAYGLTPSFSTTAVTTPDQDGVVQSQSPSAGTTVNKGDTVQVVVGSYTATTTTSTPSTTTTTSTTATSTSSSTS